MNQRRGSVMAWCALLCVVALFPGAGVSGAAAQTPGGPDQVRALVYCDGPSVSISIDNGFWNSIELTYVAAFSTPQALDPTFSPISADAPAPQHIDRHAWLQIEATAPADWEGDARMAHGVLVVTTAGVLMPMCNEGFSGLLDDPGETPVDIVDANRILVTAAMMTIGRLESLRAYDALYALLHPDVQERVPPAALACWYAGQYGTARDWKDSVFSTDVDAISTVEDWEWIAGGTTYRQAIAVDYTQEIGTLTSSAQTVEETMHFVLVDGTYRWFFGNRVNSLNHLDTDCGR
ncbi:MAG: hypothetical protein QM753_04685 [Thermomicrobiales bacterium]